MNNNSKKTENINAIIAKMMKSWGLEPKMKEMNVIKAWEELMGKGVAYRTEKIKIQNKVLHLKMNSSVMREELSYGKAVIIQRVNEYAGEELITDVWFE